MRRPNDVGVAWKKQNERGEYISIALDLHELLELTGGAVEKVNIAMYPINSENPKAPDYQLKHYPKQTTGTAPRPSSPPLLEDPPLTDDDIPF